MPPWLSRLATLNAARTAARGIAPHKPLMLLTVIDLIESGDVPEGWVRYVGLRAGHQPQLQPSH